MIYNFFKFFWHRIVPAEIFSKILFRRFWKYWMNLNNPKTFGEKIQWLKLRAERYISSNLVDKYKVREYVEKKIGKKYLVPLLKVLDSVSDITKNNLPNTPFIIKTNHDSGFGFIFRNIDDHNLETVRSEIEKRMKINHYYHTKEYPYKSVKPKILVEKLLINEQGNIPNDIKIHCFNSEPRFIYCSVDRESKDIRGIFDQNFKPLKMTLGKDPSKFKNDDISKPKQLDLMLELASKLSKGLPYVRVDIYDMEDELYFGEMTFFQGSGFDPLFPFEMDKFWGTQLEIDHIKLKEKI